MLYIVKFSGHDPANYETEDGWKQYALDGCCEYILDGYTGEILYKREHFYVIVEAGSKKDTVRAFDTFDKAFKWAMHTAGIAQFRISVFPPEEYTPPAGDCTSYFIEEETEGGDD